MSAEANPTSPPPPPINKGGPCPAEYHHPLPSKTKKAPVPRPCFPPQRPRRPTPLLRGGLRPCARGGPARPGPGGMPPPDAAPPPPPPWLLARPPPLPLLGRRAAHVREAFARAGGAAQAATTTTATGPPSPMAGTRWVLGALLRGCGCSCSSCRQTGAACLPLRPAAAALVAASPSAAACDSLGPAGRRRRLLSFLGAATQSRGFASAAGPVPGFGALRGSLLSPGLAARCYGQVGLRSGALLGVLLLLLTGSEKGTPRDFGVSCRFLSWSRFLFLL